MRNEDDLIYDLIFSEIHDFNIDISEYIDNIYNYSSFVSKIKKILKKSKVELCNSNIMVGSKTVIWELKVKK